MTRAVAHPTPEDLERARAVVAAHLTPTPVVPLALPGGDVLAKLDSLQPTGSFKVRGALAAVSAYAAPGVRLVAASAGNHALGITYAARLLSVSATVVVPATVSPAKLAALEALGADVVRHGAGYDQAEGHALRLGGAYVSPYNDPHVIAGQATWAAETALPGEATLVVPVGGGGLLAGTVLWAAARPGLSVVGVEAEASQGLSSSVAAGHVVKAEIAPTLADGLEGNLEPGSITPAIARGRATLVTVTEAEIAEAIRFLAHGCGLVAEGAGAAGVAALLAGRVPVRGRPVVLISGRNIAPATLHGVWGSRAG